MLEWDSNFWGFGCAKVLGDRLQTGQLAAIDAWCGLHGIAFLQYLAPADEPASALAAQEGGFRLVDERVTLAYGIASAPLRESKAPVELQLGRAEDLLELEAIARGGHTDSRYYHDPGFPRVDCDSLYAVWIRRSLEGTLADAVFVPVVDGKAAGYVTCKRDAESKIGWIGLLGVSTEAQGRGVGSALVRRAIEWFQEAGMDEVHVVTQGRNDGAQRVYRRCGFLPHDTGLWFHKWYRTTTGDGDQRSAKR
jgi:GNAT superfamily N-acetyltransferase